jgi:hypothetical protein
MERGLTPEWNDEDGTPLCDIPSGLRDWIDKRWSRWPDERGNMEELAAKLKKYASEVES